MDHEPERRPASEDGPDPLAPLVELLLGAADLPAPELTRRVREALPSAVSDVAESNRTLRDAAHRLEALVVAAATALRDAAGLIAVARGASQERDPDAARLRRIADDLERSLNPSDAPEGLAGAPRVGAGRPHLLVADDDPDARDALVLTLQADYEISIAVDGEAAVERARTEHPDVVLMDVLMPRLDGLQALERIRADPATSDIPVIFVSGHGDDGLKARSFELGAVDYLQKPFSERELRARVERTLRIARSQTALRELAQTDPLTGLANLRAFRARLEDEVKRARRYGTPLTCVMADMDDLKPVNDQLGHAAGDRAIAAVAAVVRAELRETDFGARYGGDEFVLLLPHTSADEGRVLAERVCARLKASDVEIAGRPIPIGASFGVSCLSGDAPESTAEALVSAADAALYDAKRAGRGRVSVAPPLAADGGGEHG